MPGLAGETFLDGDRIVTTVRGTREEIRRRSEMWLIGWPAQRRKRNGGRDLWSPCGCSLEAIRSVLKTFPGLEHALEVVRERGEFATSMIPRARTSMP
ncbi:MAG: hypothetical protein U0231_09525 [Nitrospiraceae bacterium]